MITNLDLKKAANDLAFETINDSVIAIDKSCADRAAELQLTDPQYTAFKQSVNQFRQLYAQALQQDAQAAQRDAALKKSAAGVPPAVPTPIAIAVPPAPPAPALKVVVAPEAPAA